MTAKSQAGRGALEGRGDEAALRELERLSTYVYCNEAGCVFTGTGFVHGASCPRGQFQVALASLRLSRQTQPGAEPGRKGRR